MWVITITSHRNLSDRTRDFIAELIDNENHKVVKKYRFILHDIIEDKKSSTAIIEGSEVSAKNIVLMLKHNLPYSVSYRRVNN